MKVTNKLLKELLDLIYEEYSRMPAFTSLLAGKYNSEDRFPDLSLEGLKKDNQIRQGYKQRVTQIMNTQKLNSYDQLAAEELIYFIDYTMFPASCIVPMNCPFEEFYYLMFNITPYNMPVAELWDSIRLFDCSTKESVLRHMAMAKDYERFTKQIRDKVFEQSRRGIYLFYDALEGAVNIVKKCCEIDYYKHPFCMDRPGSAAEKWQMDIEKEYVERAGKHLQEIAAFLQSDEYKNAAPKALGWNQYENGLEFYRYLRKYHLNYDISSKELHELGKGLLNEVTEKQEKIREQLDFTGSHEEFVASLKCNERFYPKKPEDVGRLMKEYIDRAAQKMPEIIKETIKTPMAVERLDENLEPMLTFGYFQPSSNVDAPGIYYYNGSDLENKCQMNIPALMAHEMLSGHHFQQSLVYESETIHPLFKDVSSSCYMEGWGEYSAILASEEGLFQDAYDEYGRLEMEKFTCTRLILDTGLNELGWTREQAERFMIENTFATEMMAKSEVMRYAASIPAQCLPYRYGCVKMLELRDKFKAKKGADFDLKEFHSMILNVGNVPMHLLEKYLERELA